MDSGRDIGKWQRRAVEKFAPAAPFGQDFPSIGVQFGPVIAPDERVKYSFPCFVDDNPRPQSQAAESKVKFNGNRRNGLIAVTNEAPIWLEDAGRAIFAASVPLVGISELNAIQFKFSMMSMTSAGPGYEILGIDMDQAPFRLLFRVALQPRDSSDFERALRADLI